MAKHTVRDVIGMTVRDLGQIKIPAELIEEIGIPIMNALHNLKQCEEAIDREMAAAAPAEDEPVIELFSEDELVDTIPAEESENE